MDIFDADVDQLALMGNDVDYPVDVEYSNGILTLYQNRAVIDKATTNWNYLLNSIAYRLGVEVIFCWKNDRNMLF